MAPLMDKYLELVSGLGDRFFLSQFVTFTDWCPIDTAKNLNVAKYIFQFKKYITYPSQYHIIPQKNKAGLLNFLFRYLFYHFLV